MKKILIVGAGPAGGYLGQLLKAEGFDCLLIEDDPLIGHPVRCAGILGQDVFENLKFKIPEKSIINVIDGAVIHLADKKFSLKRAKVAYLVNRDVFDQSLSDGLKIQLNNRFLSLSPKGPGYLVKTSQGEIYADIVVGADGPTSLVRKYIPNIKTGFISGYQVTIKNNFSVAKNILEVYFVKPFHEFIWVVPESEDTLRIGAMAQDPKGEVLRFLADKGLRGPIIKENGGIIPIGYLKTVKDNLVLLGDAAAQVKPLSGGGIFYGLKCAEILADCLKYDRLKNYDALWKRQFGLEIKLGLKARQVFSQMSPRVLGELFDILAEVSGKIESGGNFELHSTVFRRVIKNPRFWRVLGPAIIAFLKTIW